MFYLRLHLVFTQNHWVKTTQTRVHSVPCGRGTSSIVPLYGATSVSATPPAVEG